MAVDASAMITALGQLGYRPVLETDHHVRLTCIQERTFTITAPNDGPIKPETLDAILGVIAPWHRMGLDELAERLFG